MSDRLEIQSHKGPYTVDFVDDVGAVLDTDLPRDAHFVIDQRVADLYRHPLASVLASPSVLLDERDVRSGVGEMLKVHVIDGPSAFDAIAADYDRVFTDRTVMRRYIRRLLEIKKTYIERDEFDRGPRNIFNYGHSFGHAIESATQFAVPHGIAVTIGMDMANWISARLGIGSEDHYRRMHPVLRRNYRGFEHHDVPLDPFLSALGKDKKNVGSGTATLILPDSDARIAKGVYPVDADFRDLCATYLGEARAV